MKVKFKNGETKNCTTPTEQKLFRDGVAAGWLLSFSIKEGDLTSDSLDSILTPENVSSLIFINTDENSEDKELCTLVGYSKITSAVIRHGVNSSDIRADIQIVKSLS